MTTLAELRQANLKEQNAPKPGVPAPEAAPHTVPALLSEAVPPAESAVPDLTAPSLRLSVAAAVPTEEQQRDALYLARVRESLSRKVIHPTGAKATVDMEPALFHRAKRFCNEHGNISLRQVFLDLLTAYLEEEGY